MKQLGRPKTNKRSISQQIILLATLQWGNTALSNVIGSDTQNFVPTTNGLDFVSVQSSETLMPGYWNFGLFANHAINTLPYSSEKSGVRDRITGLDFSAGYGVLKNLDIGIGLPYLASQNIDDEGARGEFGSTGLTEIRANLKFRFLGGQDKGLAAIFSYNQNLISNNPYAGSGAGPTFNIELAADTTYKKFAVAGNIGYRKRTPGDQIAEFEGIAAPKKDDYIYSGALSYYFDQINSKMIWEVFGSTPAQSSSSSEARKVSTGETILGIKHQLSDSLALHGGAGTELQHGTSSARLRVYTGINWNIGPNKSKPTIRLVKKRKKPKYKKNIAKIKKSRKTVKTPSGKKTTLQDSPFLVAHPPIPAPPAKEKQEVKEPKKPMIAPFPTDKSEMKEPNLGGDEVIVLRDIHFLFDSDKQVLQGAKSTLRKLSQYLKSIQVEKVIIEGHTDSMGSIVYNQGLSLRRSLTVLRYLYKIEGIPQNLLRAKGYGERYPVADNGNHQGRQLNRRVVFRIFYK